MRILFHKDDPLATGVEQQLDTGHAGTGCHVACVDAVDIFALEHGILLSMDRLTGIKVCTTWRIPTGARMRMPTIEMVGRINMVAVRQTSRYAVVPGSQHMASSVQQHAANCSAAAGRSLGSQQGQLQGPLVAAGSHVTAPTNGRHHPAGCHGSS